MDAFLAPYSQATEQVQAAGDVCQLLFDRGWSERNGGNISINLTGLIDNDKACQGSWVTDDRITAAGVKGIYYVTGTGCRLRDVAKAPGENAAILEVDPDQGGYRILAGGKTEGFAPTSEFISHLAIHAMRQESGSSHRALIHAHAIELLCMTHNAEFVKDPVAMNRMLWGILPEIRVFIPKGVALVPYALPGSETLARATVEAFRIADVALWEKHGALATGVDAQEAFDFMDVANKGAIIVLSCMAAGFRPEGMTDEQLEELEAAFLD